MDKSQKKLLAVIISVVLAFTVGITCISLLQMPDLDADNSARITIGEARTMVLEYAGAQESDVVFTNQDTHIRPDMRIYKLEFNDGTMEYEFKIDAHTGEIIESSSEPLD
ncbi:MAG: PepSY domain-containing protein [Eubacterium sp.]|nr:PepSY domain-containing protein [Eubacterium sp.]MDE6155114.1 PepSY domain-containing protein [Eubacterium sp.]MDE6767493.1 PepSY domain-containing protein [Eubacterium sp.]